MSNSVCYASMKHPVTGAYYTNNSADFGEHRSYVGPAPSVLNSLRSHISADNGKMTTAFKHGTNEMALALNAENCHSVLISGTMPSFDLSDEFSASEKVKTPDFRKKVRAGEIVVNPYQKHTTQLTYKPQPVIVDRGPCDHYTYAQFNITGRNYFKFNRYNFVEMNGRNYSVSQYVGRRHGELTGWKHPLEFVTRAELESKFKILVPMLDDPDFVQGTFADANGRSVDFLTSVFELPETILSIGDVWKSVRKVIQNFIAKRNLTDQERRAYLLRHSRLVDNARINLQKFSRLLVNESDPEKRKKIQKSIDYWTRRLKKLGVEKNKFLLSLATTVSNLWLRFRYEIMPNIYLCQGLAETAESQWNVFQTERNKMVIDAETPNLDGFTFKGKSQVTWKCMVKYGYSNTAQSLRDLRKAFSTNAFLTLWELGKLSFVIDWFFSVGNFLGSAFGKPSIATTDGATLSSKWEIDGDYTHTDSSTSFHIKYTGYIRRVVTSQEFQGIFFRINLNWMRYADAGALLFGELKRHFKLK